MILNVHNALFYCFSRVSIRIWVVCSCACSILDQQHDFDPHSCFLQQSKECLSTLHRLEMLTNTDKLVLFWIFFEWLPYVVCVTEQLLHWLCAANIDTQIHIQKQAQHRLCNLISMCIRVFGIIIMLEKNYIFIANQIFSRCILWFILNSF